MIGSALLLAAVLTLPVAAAQDAGSRLAFEGAWVLNAELSDDPRPRPDVRRGDRPGGRRGGGRFGGGGRPDREAMAARRGAIQEAMRDLLTAARRMTITGTPDKVILTYDDGRVVRLLPDGREHAGLAGTSLQVARTTRWDDAALVTDIKLEARVPIAVEQRYELREGAAGRQLVVTSRFDGRSRGGDDRELRRIYDAEAPS